MKYFYILFVVIKIILNFASKIKTIFMFNSIKVE